MNSKGSTTMSSRRLLWLPAVLFTLALLAAACGGDDTADTTTSTETTASDATTSTDSSDDSSDDDSDDSGSDESSDDEAALEAAADELVVVCADQDRDRLRDLSGDGTKDRVRDRDPLFSVVDDLSVVDRVVSIDGDTATVTVTLEVTIDGEATQVDRVWTYGKVDGTWVLADVPDCLFS